MLVALVPLVLHLGRLAGRGTVAKAGSVAMVALAAISIAPTSTARIWRSSPRSRIPANLIIMATLITLAVGLRKRAGVSLPVAVGLPLTWILLLPLSAVGGRSCRGRLLRRHRLPASAPTR